MLTIWQIVHELTSPQLDDRNLVCWQIVWLLILRFLLVCWPIYPYYLQLWLLLLNDTCINGSL